MLNEILQIPGCGKVELGATWFHGIHGNPLYEHAVQFGLINRDEAEKLGEQAAQQHCPEAVHLQLLQGAVPLMTNLIAEQIHHGVQ